jgi:hypothetical protein
MTERFTVHTHQSNLYGRALNFVALGDDEDTFVVEFDWTGVGSIDGDTEITDGDARVIAANDPGRTMFITTPISDPIPDPVVVEGEPAETLEPTPPPTIVPPPAPRGKPGPKPKVKGA